MFGIQKIQLLKGTRAGVRIALLNIPVLAAIGGVEKYAAFPGIGACESHNPSDIGAHEKHVAEFGILRIIHRLEDSFEFWLRGPRLRCRLFFRLRLCHGHVCYDNTQRCERDPSIHGLPLFAELHWAMN